MNLKSLIDDTANELAKARVHNNKLSERRAKILLAHLLELREHRKFHGIDKIIERA